jgi:hypothetical protein
MSLLLTPSPLGDCGVMGAKAGIPAETGIQFLKLLKFKIYWMPAFASMMN